MKKMQLAQKISYPN